MSIGFKIDGSMCQGHGQCYYACPEVFTPDSEGFGQVIDGEIDPALELKAQRAMENCPERAISRSDQ
jgi:ferredoxin